MKNTLLITLIFIVFSCKINAQDCIFFENGKVVTGKITAIGAGKITFTQTDSIGTLTRTVYSNRVHYIKYNNGKTDTVPGNENYANHRLLQFYHKKLAQQQLINISLYPLFQYIYFKEYTEVNLNYEYIIKKINLGVYIPFDYNFGYHSLPGSYEFLGLYKLYGSGIGVRLYSNNQFNHSFYLGAGFLLDKIKVYKMVDYVNGYGVYAISHSTQYTKYMQFGHQNFIGKRAYLVFNLNLGGIDVKNFSRESRYLLNAEIKLGYKIK